MRFSILREDLLRPLQLVVSVVERRNTLPVLANVLIEIKENFLFITGTDLEVELSGKIQLVSDFEAGRITVPAKKLIDICKNLPDQSMIDFSVADNKFEIRCDRSRFNLMTLPAEEFPSVDVSQDAYSFQVHQLDFRAIIEKTAFAMAVQDVRYYLNGMLLEVSPEGLKAVSTDGHRLALAGIQSALPVENKQQIIIPRKGIMELVKLLQDDENVDLLISANHISARTKDFTFVSKLVDGKFPDYDRVIPKNGTKPVIADRVQMKQMFTRSAILTNEKYHGVRLEFSTNELKISANNPEQDSAEEIATLDYGYEPLEIGFNVHYLLDVMTVLTSEQVKMIYNDANSSVLIQSPESDDAVYVVMPMRL